MTENVEDTMPAMSQDEALRLLNDARQRQADDPPITIVGLVRRMRAAQIKYFKTRAQADLIEAKRLEAHVDTWLRNDALNQTAREAPPPAQGTAA